MICYSEKITWVSTVVIEELVALVSCCEVKPAPDTQFHAVDCEWSYRLGKQWKQTAFRELGDDDPVECWETIMPVVRWPADIYKTGSVLRPLGGRRALDDASSATSSSVFAEWFAVAFLHNLQYTWASTCSSCVELNSCLDYRDRAGIVAWPRRKELIRATRYPRSSPLFSSTQIAVCGDSWS